MAQFAVGADIVDRQHVFAAHSHRARVPAEAALQEKAAEADAFAMADRKEKLLRGQEIVDLIAAAARPDHGAHIPRIDRHRVETRDIEQHAAVAHMVA